MMFEKTYGLLEIPTLAAELLQALQPSPTVWLFSGEMGAGKTSLIKELGKQIGIRQSVQSPTFSLVNSYETKDGKPVYHFDLYRLKNTAEAIDIGIEEYLDSGYLCFIEWPEKTPNLIPIDHAHISIKVLADGRRELVLKN